MPRLPSVSLRFCVLPGVHVFLIHGFRLPLRFSFGFFLSRLRCYALRFLFCILFFLSFSIRTFRRLPSLAAVSSVPVRSSFFLCVCGIGRLAWLFPALPLLSLVYLPHSLSFRFVTSLHSLGALLTRSHLRFPPRRGLPLGRVRSCLASLHSSFASLRTPSDLSLCLHPPTSLPLLLQSVVRYG